MRAPNPHVKRKTDTIVSYEEGFSPDSPWFKSWEMPPNNLKSQRHNRLLGTFKEKKKATKGTILAAGGIDMKASPGDGGSSLPLKGLKMKKKKPPFAGSGGDDIKFGAVAKVVNKRKGFLPDTTNSVSGPLANKKPVSGRKLPAKRRDIKSVAASRYAKRAFF